MSIQDRSAPCFYVKVFSPGDKSGKRVDVSERILSFEFDDDERTAHKLTIELDNFDLEVFDDPLWRKGNQLEFAWGYAGNLAPARTGVIQTIKGFQTLKIEALSKSILMNKQVRSRVFERMTRAQIVASIAKENGYGTGELDIEDTALVLEHVAQARLTDAQFLASLARKEGFEFYVDFDGVHFHRRKVGAKPKRVFVFYTDPGAGDILSISIENDITAAPGKVTTVGRDPIKKTDINVSADNSNTQRDSLAPVIEIIDPTTGEATLKNQAASAVTLTSAKDAASAKREADGRFIQGQQTAVQLTMNAVGDPRVGAKQVIEIRGISKRLSGKYYVKAAKHKLSGSEYTMTLKCRSDGGRGGAGASSQTTSGGKPNTQGASDPNELTPVESVDPTTGETRTTYKKGS